jgi:ribosomal protein L24E
MKAHYCPICGKEFYPTLLWVYKDVDEEKTTYYCSYKCHNTIVKKREYNRTIKYTSRKIVQLDLDEVVLKTFNSAYDAADAVLGKACGVRNACHEKTKYKNFLWRYADEMPEMQ